MSWDILKVSIAFSGQFLSFYCLLYFFVQLFVLPNLKKLFCLVGNIAGELVETFLDQNMFSNKLIFWCRTWIALYSGIFYTGQFDKFVNRNKIPTLKLVWVQVLTMYGQLWKRANSFFHWLPKMNHSRLAHFNGSTWYSRQLNQLFSLSPPMKSHTKNVHGYMYFKSVWHS